MRACLPVKKPWRSVTRALLAGAWILGAGAPAANAQAATGGNGTAGAGNISGSGQTEAPQKVDLQYAFGPQAVAGYTQVTPDTVYTKDRGYGFDLGSQVEVVNRGGADPAKSGYATGAKGRPFFFSTKLAPGAYAVTVTLGGTGVAGNATVKSETRRLMLEAVKTHSGETVTRTFLVHIRVPTLPDGSLVRMKPRENQPNQLFIQWDEKTQVSFMELDWDEKLTLEFSGDAVALDTVTITNAEKPVTVYLIGDSTVTDQMMEPWGAWGMMLPRWFKPPVLIANYAESGETTASFIGEKRWAKLLSEIHPGDYVFMQFGINDQRMAVDQFKQYFIQFIADTRAHGATPVLVTSQNLRKLDENGKAVQTLRDFPDAMRAAAKEQNVALIDLNAMSGALYEAIGPAQLPKAFVDGTHQNDYGSYELAKCVVNGILWNKLPWAQYVADDWKGYDPAKPDPMEAFALPKDPQLDPKQPGATPSAGSTTTAGGNAPLPASPTGNTTQ
jgi:lysophospholipase L1-like esterase